MTFDVVISKPNLSRCAIVRSTIKMHLRYSGNYVINRMHTQRQFDNIETKLNGGKSTKK